MNINTVRLLVFVFFPMAFFTYYAGFGDGTVWHFEDSVGGFFLCIMPLYNFVYFLAILNNHCKGIDVSFHFALNKLIWLIYLASIMLWLFFFIRDDDIRAFDIFVKPAYLDPSPITDPDWNYYLSKGWDQLDTGHQRIMLKESTTYSTNDPRPHLNWKDLNEEQKQRVYHWCRERNGNYPDWCK